MIVRYLVENGADVNAQGGEYRDALSAAEAKEIHNIVLQKGAIHNILDDG
jgi:hypothetical protein